MPAIPLEQALFYRPDGATPNLIARSPGFDAAWIAEAQHLVFGFGDRRVGMRCPLTVFAQPIDPNHVAVVRVMDDVGEGGPNGLRFHFLVVSLESYEAWIRDPFMLAEKVAPTWQPADALPSLTIPEEAFSPRTLAQLQDVLKRIKASALKEGEDPEAPDFERTIENSESPALLGGAQILVDGGRLVFERPEGDLRMVSGLWLLLPEETRCRLWPASFAFSRDLEFDVLVVPHLGEVPLESYTTEEQAADYPEGAYEVALQSAVETGTQDDLDEVFSRRDSHSTIRLALICLILVSAIVILSRFIDFAPAPPQTGPTVPQQQAAAAAGIVGVGDPFTSFGMILYGKTIWKGDTK
ncbi:MAG: hypothetical protein FJ303_14825 [Planctomycetes bacterium]|nr:hypothetical protein [Planctomycetota bacterium]